MQTTETVISQYRNRLVLTDEEIEKNRAVYSNLYNLSYADVFNKVILNPIREVWFRARFINLEPFPTRTENDSPLIFAANHSGMAFPWDAIAFISKIIERGQNTIDNIRALISPLLTKFPYMCPFMIDGLWWKAGCINATFLNFETGMKLNLSNILIFPEGLEGIGKGFDKRYKLQPFKTSFLRMSIRYKTDIIPILTVNGEYNNPLAYNIKKITRKGRNFGLPFFPFGPIIFLAIFQPWIFYISLPSRLTFVLGKRIKAYEMIDKPYEDITQKDLKDIGEKIRQIMQRNLNEAVEKYGDKFYDIKGLIKAMWKNRKNFFRYFPAFWPCTMTYFDVNYSQEKGQESLKLTLNKCLKTIAKRPILLAMYLPILGWPIIALHNTIIMRRRKKKQQNKIQ